MALKTWDSAVSCEQAQMSESCEQAQMSEGCDPQNAHGQRSVLVWTAAQKAAWSG